MPGPNTNVFALQWNIGLKLDFEGVTQILRFGVGGNANFRFGVFRYQHVGIPNAKFWRWGSKQMPGPNANVFESQWNIGFKLDF